METGAPDRLLAQKGLFANLAGVQEVTDPPSMTDLMGDIWTVYGADGEVVGIEIRGLGAT